MSKDNLKYIYGITDKGEETHTFETINDMDIYYNTDTNLYLLSLDLTSDNFKSSEAKITLDNLLNKFHYYMDDNKLWEDYNFDKFWNGDLFSAENLSDLFYGFRIFCNGIKEEIR